MCIKKIGVNANYFSFYSVDVNCIKINHSFISREHQKVGESFRSG